MTAEDRAKPIVVKLPVALQFEQWPAAIKAETSDIGAQGILLRMSPAPPLGTQLSLTITLPEEITLTEDIEVRCIGRITRVEESAAGEPALIAASIESYESVVAAPTKS